jgi:pyruvate kinase
MRKICVEAESMELSSDYPKIFAALLKSTPHTVTDDEYAAAYCVRTANDLNADLIITVTHTGHSSRAVTKYRPRVPIICISGDEKVVNWLVTSKATIPILVDSIENKNSSQLVEVAFKVARELGLIRKGSLVVLQAASDTSAGSTQTVKVLSVSD